MCAECNKTPCDSRCPNAPEPTFVMDCARCGEPIPEGEDYFEEPDGDALCMGCADGMTASDVFRYFGCERRTAGE